MSESLKFLRKLRGRANLVKIGSQLFTAEGPEAVRRIAKLVPGTFLDLKFCDIPNTVAGAVRAAAELPGVRMMTLHTTGGLAMMQAARAALKGIRRPPMLLGVTVLTSLDELDLARIGLAGPLGDRVAALAAMAQVAGLDGVVAPARELQSLRKSLRKKMAFVVPGIRTVAPSHSSTSPRRDDQAQIATPGNAIRWGADYLVVGRPITAAPDPVAAMDSILHDMQFALTYRE
ncbi:MAG TPA: orotidine-5'-phosphate decarboxylase [Candidatus Acidoferrales bacterium]|nr:orotidine-5'-phosphate decarboxylase [Candidatus Acidoferrales bacterium]